MSEGLNRWVGVGQLAADPELRFTQSNQGVLSFRIAVNEGYWDEKTKERKEKVEWVPICVWGKRGEALNKILAKGRQVLIEGRLQTRSWDDKTGAKRYTTEIVASNVILLGGRGQQAEAVSEPAGSGYGQQQQQLGTSDDEDQIPF
jgi:single-strand DNA-binding protein